MTTTVASPNREPAAPPIGADELGELLGDGRPLAVELGRLPSALALIIEELAGFGETLSARWRAAAASRLDRRDLAALRPLARARRDRLPGCLWPLTDRPTTGVVDPSDDLERIAATPPDQLVAQLPPDPVWDVVARHPARWLAAYVRAAGRACEGLREPWRAAAGLLDREAERIGVAAVLGTQRELIANRFPPTLWRVESAAPPGAEPRSGPLRLVPALVGSGSTHAWTIGGELSHLLYPLPGAWRLLDRDAPPPAQLEGLLGRQRALILRQLDRPVSSGQIAEALIAVPSAASHHLAILERAGLVERERRGRHVLVRRTARGSEILALYDGGATIAERDGG